VWYLYLARDVVARWVVAKSAYKASGRGECGGTPLSHVHSAGKSRRSKGKHRKAKQRTEAYAWLGAGAITLGVGAAMVSGAGVAHAEDDTGGTDSPSSSSPSDPSPSSPSSPSSGGAATVTTGSVTSPPSESTETVTPVTTGGGSGTTVTTTATNGSPKTTISYSGGFLQSEVKDKADPVERQKEPVDPVVTFDIPPKLLSAPEVTGKLAPDPEVIPAVIDVPVQLDATISDSQYIEADSVEPVGSPNLALRVMALTSTLAVNPAREAYLQQFRNADPNGIYLTPASADYIPNPNTYTPEEYRADIQLNVNLLGTRGFAQTSSGALQYTNTYNQNVAIVYGPQYGGGRDPAGIVIARPGQTIVIPYPSGIFAQAQLPRSANGQYNNAGVAALGYPPFTRGVTTPTTPAPPAPLSPAPPKSSTQPKQVQSTVNQSQKASQQVVKTSKKNLNNLQSLANSVAAKLQHDIVTLNFPALYDSFASLHGIASDILEITKKTQAKLPAIFGAAVSVANIPNTISELEKNLEVALNGGNGNVFVGTYAFVKSLVGVAELTTAIAGLLYGGTSTAVGVAVVDLFVQGASYELSKLDRALGR
jgi:hypothetical protein